MNTQYATLRYRDSADDSWLTYQFESFMEAYECMTYRIADGWRFIQLAKDSEDGEFIILNLIDGEEQ